MSILTTNHNDELTSRELPGYCRWYFGLAPEGADDLAAIIIESEAMLPESGATLLKRLRRLSPKILPGREYLWELLEAKFILLDMAHRAEKEDLSTEPKAAEKVENDEISAAEKESESEAPKKKGIRIKDIFVGGGKDGVGKFGAIGDFVGGVTDRLGVTNYGLAGSSSEKKDKEKKTSTTQDIITADSSSIELMLRALGLEQEADMIADNGDINSTRRSLAPYVGIEPRDTRLDRLLRLSLRLMPKGDDGDEQRYVLLSTLAELANELSKWTRVRLEARHSGAIGNLLEDSLTLGKALDRIPGPGVPLPLDADDHDLPTPDDIEGLSDEVNILKRRVLLSSSGGVR